LLYKLRAYDAAELYKFEIKPLCSANEQQRVHTSTEVKSCAPSSFRDHADILAYNKCRLAICTPVAEHDNFLLRDATLARYMLSSCVRLSVCHKPVLHRNHGCFLPPIPHCVKFGYLQNKGTSLWNFVPKSGKFCATSRSHCQQNSSTVEPVDDTYTTVDESWLFTTSRSAVTL